MTVTASSRAVSLAEGPCGPDVRIVPRSDAGHLNLLTPHRFRLLFPATWKSPYPAGNVYADAFERPTLEWLSRFGLVTDEEDMQTLRRFSCGRYGGYSSPRANFRDGLLITQFVSLWLFWDDKVIEEGTGWSVTDVVSAMNDEVDTQQPDGFLNAWNDLCARLRRTQTKTWTARLAREMEAWMRNAKLETENARRYRQSNVSTAFETMLNIRTISIGMYPTFHLIEMTEGVELPEGFHHHPVVVEMKRVASRLVSFGNDLGGLAKDIAGDWPNLVTTLQAELQVSIEDAFRVIVDMHNADIEVFDELEQHLPTYDPDVDLQIRGWVQAVRYSVLGFTLWESLAERYQAVKPVIRDKVLAAPVTFLQPS